MRRLSVSLVVGEWSIFFLGFGVSCSYSPHYTPCSLHACAHVLFAKTGSESRRHPDFDASIVNVGSIAGEKPLSSVTPYSIAKVLICFAFYPPPLPFSFFLSFFLSNVLFVIMWLVFIPADSPLVLPGTTCQISLSSPLLCLWSAPKAGLMHLTKCNALEFAPFRIRVNCINPATILTNWHRAAGLSEEKVNMAWHGMA